MLVTGETAEVIDYRELTDPWLPIVFVFVLALSFVLLTVAFRSVVLAGASRSALNLLSVGAAYGLIVLVFLEGRRPRPARLHRGGGDRRLAAALPLRRALRPLDGLHGLPALADPRAVTAGSRDDGGRRVQRRLDRAADHGRGADHHRVFVGFAAGDQVEFQQMGFGVAVSLLIDATVCPARAAARRAALLGERNWYLPGWLDWLPHLEVEGRTAGSDRVSSG